MKTATWLLALLLTGCVTLYSAPAADEPHAELMFTSNLDDKPAPDGYARNNNMFYAFADAGCKQALGGMGKFVGMFDGDGIDTYRVAAGKRIYIRASSTTVSYNGNMQTTHYCHNFVSFVPEERQVYVMHQEAAHERTGFGQLVCSASIRSRDELDPVKSLVEHPFEGECRRLIGR